MSKFTKQDFMCAVMGAVVSGFLAMAALALVVYFLMLATGSIV